MKAAERLGEPGTMLFLHEFFEVNVRGEGQGTSSQIYQALEFAPQDDGSVHVKGQYYCHPKYVRGHARVPVGTHTYDEASSSEDGDLALRDVAPELVKVDNCTAWFSMASLTDGKPRVVHPDAIKDRSVHIAGKEQHWVCGSVATELAPNLPGTGSVGPYGFSVRRIARDDIISRPEDVLGEEYTSCTSEWDNMELVFAGIRGVLRCGSGARSGSFETPWSLQTFRFWNQVTDTKRSDWARSASQTKESRFDATFNYQQVHRDIERLEVVYKSKRDMRRLQMVSGFFGMVAVAKETEQGQDAIHRFETGTNLRVVTSDACLKNAEPGMLPEEYWTSRRGTHGSVRLRFDREKGQPRGTLKVTVVWYEVTFNDRPGFEDDFLIV